MNRSAPPRRQHGLSIIELMVGMVIALVAVVASMSIYKSTAKNTAESRLGANMDGQIAAGLLAADRFLQGAGFGYATGSNLYGVQLQAFQNSSTVALGTAGNALVWMVDAAHCQALVASGKNLTFYGGGSGYSCTSPTLPAGSVAGQPLITAPTAVPASSPNMGNTTITVSTVVNCVPFGVSSVASGGSYSALLSTTGYAGGQAIQSRTCLFNYH